MTLICVVEEPASLEAKIYLGEEDAAAIRPGQLVQLEARTLPFDRMLRLVRPDVWW